MGGGEERKQAQRRRVCFLLLLLNWICQARAEFQRLMKSAASCHSRHSAIQQRGGRGAASLSGVVNQSRVAGGRRGTKHEARGKGNVCGSAISPM